MKIVNTLSIAALLCVSVFSTSAFATHGDTHGWQLSADESLVAYGSIKKNVVGEVNHFDSISGGIASDGKVAINIDLASVNTKVDIRNQRMIKHVFGDNAQATLKTALDMSVIDNLVVGASTIMEVEGFLTFLGNEVEVDTNFFVIKLSDTKILATTNDMIMLPTGELGINAGIDKLMELAKLPGITRVSPVTLRFMFEMQK